MQKKNITIFSSSNIAFQNSFWKNFKSKYNCKYKDFIDIKNILNINHKIDILIIILFYEDIFVENKKLNLKNLNQILFFIDHFTKKNKTKLIFSIIENSNENIINFSQKEKYNSKLILKFKDKLFKYIKHKDNLYYIDINSVFSQCGFKNCYDNRNWYAFRMRVSFTGLKLIIENLTKLIDRIYEAPCKVLIVDCDNTLWGGIIGEDGITDIELGTDGVGKAYQDIQKQIKLLSKQGILICLCSKNNEEDVWNVFDNHPEMILKKNDLTFSIINWQEKAKNIINVSKKLNLNLDSFVLLDDNPLERNIVKNILPNVNVLELPEDVSLWPDLISNNYFFSNFRILKDDKLKKDQYIKRAKFVKDYSLSKNKSNFLKNISIEPNVEKLNDFTFARASQMTLKTNQFNFRTQRYTIDEIKQISNQKNSFNFIMRVKDKYGDHGYIGLIMLEKISQKDYFITNFLMSCRILGRDLEKWFLIYICKKLLKNNVGKLILEYIPSKSNTIANHFLKENKFKKLKNYNNNKLKIKKENTFYQLKIKDFSNKKHMLYSLSIYEKIKKHI